MGCMQPVCRRSSSELQISVCTMLKDAAMLSWPGLVKQVLPSKDSCWLASANGVLASMSPGKGRTVLQTIVLPRFCSSSSSSGGAANAARSRGAAWQPTAAAAVVIANSSSNKQRSSYREQLQQLHSSGKRAKYSTVHCKINKNSCPKKGQRPKTN